MDITRNILPQGPSLGRRQFLGSAGALVIAVHFPGTLLNPAQAAAPASFAPNAYVRIGADDSVTIVVALVEMGQGTYTSIPMLIAEELSVDMSKVKVEHAPADEARYGHPLFGLQVTGGSQSVPGAWKGLRQAGAAARAMLVSAAAQTWKVPESECVADAGVVTHARSGRKLTYGALASTAAKLPVPKDVALKDPSTFKLVGTSAHRVDTPGKVDGSAQYGIDVKLPGMKIAAIAVCPVIGGTVGTVDGSKAMAVAGVRKVIVGETAVAVVADHYGAARKGLAALVVTWKDGPGASFSNKVWGEQLAAAMEGKGLQTLNEGDFARARATAASRHDAVYETPPLAHTTMEPLNCTIHVRKDGCDVWLGTQAPARVQALVAKVVGMAPAKVNVHNYLLGGGFGRKLDADYVETAATLAKQVDYPLKVVFSREEDIQHDAYRPYFRDALSAALDAGGQLVGFSHRIAGSAVITRYAPMWISNGVDGDAVHAAETPYDVPSKVVEFIRHEPPAGLLTGNWRGVGPTHNAFVTECFIDELAVKAKADPAAYRKRMLNKNPRALAALNLAMEKSGWGSALPAGRARGVAVVDAWGSYAALVTEVTVKPDGALSVDRMVCAVDCGIAVNPDGVESQMQGGIVYGLTAVLYGTLTFEGGRVVQGNFHDYQPLRISEMPKIEMYPIKSTEAPGGTGEMGTALVAPSVMNAIFAATGKRLRTYPVTSEQLKSA